MVAELFSPIPNRGQDPLPMINDHPFGPNERSVSEFPTITPVFPAECNPSLWYPSKQS